MIPTTRSAPCGRSASTSTRSASSPGSNAHVGIGSDLDGFIKPTVAGIDDADDLARLRGPLAEAYPDDFEAILCGNAVRVLRSAYRGRGG